LATRDFRRGGSLETRDLGRGNGKDGLVEEKKKLKNVEDLSSNSSLVGHPIPMLS
jgi:hypothetical protein